MKGISGYSKPAPNGKGVVVDIEGMAVDLVTVMKAGRIERAQAIAMFAQMYDDVQVEVKRPSDN